MIWDILIGRKFSKAGDHFGDEKEIETQKVNLCALSGRPDNLDRSLWVRFPRLHRSAACFFGSGRRSPIAQDCFSRSWDRRCVLSIIADDNDYCNSGFFQFCRLHFQRCMFRTVHRIFDEPLRHFARKSVHVAVFYALRSAKTFAKARRVHCGNRTAQAKNLWHPRRIHDADVSFVYRQLCERSSETFCFNRNFMYRNRDGSDVFHLCFWRKRNL